MLSAVKRFAMNPKIVSFLKPALADAGTGKITAGSVAGRFAPDLLFGGIAACKHLETLEIN